MTETSVGVSGPDRDTGTVPGSVGRLLPSTELRVEAGELCVRGPQNSPGYLGNPAATAALIDADGWLHTGDLGHVDEDGNVLVVDRLEGAGQGQRPPGRARKAGGAPRHPPAGRVVRQRDDERGEVPVAVVVPRGDLDAEALMAWVAQRVSPYKRIRAVRTAGAIPRTPAGKSLRRYVI